MVTLILSFIGNRIARASGFIARRVEPVLLDSNWHLQRGQEVKLLCARSSSKLGRVSSLVTSPLLPVGSQHRSAFWTHSLDYRGSRTLSRSVSSRQQSSDTNKDDSPSGSFTPPATAKVGLGVLADRLQGLDRPTVWHEFSPLASKYNAVNLGQGFPDWDPPAFAIEAMVTSITPEMPPFAGSAPRPTANQYARSFAHMPLAVALVNEYSQRWQNEPGFQQRQLDPATNVATAVGCTNVLFCALQGLLNRDDEVILLEPAFDIYASQVKLAGGVPVYVPLRPNAEVIENSSQESWPGASQAFTLDIGELEAAISSKTKVLILNSPHNPTGKMFSRQELVAIANIVVKYPQLTVISDEVYEHIVYDPINEPHISIAAVTPEIYQQTLTLSSSGKAFSCTGWKVGWAIGPAHLVQAVTAIQQWCNFSAPTPNQDAIAKCLVTARSAPYGDYENYYDYLAAEYSRKRSILAKALHNAGMSPIMPPGGFFIMADTSHIDFPFDRTERTEAMPAGVSGLPRDWSLSRWLTMNVGVTAIPPSAFYSPQNIPLAANLLRFAFCKGDATLYEAERRLCEYFGPR
jgi:kynurenine---oxoglutarate transaminase / cysteine-S-conjugate beta-lyase / glutamine---phenylpyruvate transaminase